MRLVNALVHRDYKIQGSEIHVDMYDDRLEIVSPGGMPDGKRIQDLNIDDVPSALSKNKQDNNLNRSLTFPGCYS